MLNMIKVLALFSYVFFVNYTAYSTDFREEKGTSVALTASEDETISITKTSADEPGLEKEHELDILARVPTILSRLTYLLKNKLQGWDGAVRAGQTSYQAVIMSGNIGGDFPTNYDKGTVWANNMIDGIKGSGILRTWRSDRAVMFITHEFAPNVSYEVHEGTGKLNPRYDASNIITADTYSGIRDTFSKWMSEQNSGYSFILGGAAIDTGKTIEVDGITKKIGENRGFAAFSGNSLDTSVVEFTKRTRSEVDGWTEAYEVPNDTSGGNYTTIPLDNLVPGNQDLMAISICKDAAHVDSGFPMRASLIIIPGSGVPSYDTIGASNPNSTKLIADIKQQPASDNISQGNQDDYVPSELAGGLYELREGTALGRMFYTGVNFLTLNPEQVQASLESYQKVSQARITFKEGGTMLITKPRPMPATISENDLNNFEETMVKNQSPVSDQRNDPPSHSSQLEDPIGEGLQGDFNENMDKFDQAEGNFGEVD